MAGDNIPTLTRDGDMAGVAAAADMLRRGGLVAVPTETVYGLAARADSAEAVAAIYRAKGRPDFNPLIVHVSGLAEAERLAEFDDRARRVVERFWPGPLTLVLPRRADADLVQAVTAGLPTVALRSPAHAVMREVLAATGFPLAAPSANRSGGVSPTTAAHVAASLGSKVDLILDGGACVQGIESTIVTAFDAGWRMLRPGPISEAQLAELLGPQSVAAPQNRIEAPGQLASHYAPGKPVRLNAATPRTDEFHIGFGAVAGRVNLSVRADLAEAAAQLYAALHEAAASPFARIAVAPIPDHGIGAAINDRLRRAAA
jgi:L-threonylcarbamoyladenylate synthase